MSSPDATSLVALIVSLVALILTLLQVAQQYIATGNEYRHCSERTLGGWHRRSRRRFIWSELRFEVHFTTPIIRIDILPSNSKGGETYAVPTRVTTTSSPSPRSRSVSSANGAQFVLHTPEGAKHYTASQNPWFLDPKGTRPEAKCSWLSLLNDTTVTHLQIGIDELTLSYDFMPDGIKKPPAQMDRKSFLTLMSLFQVSWQEGWGRDGGKVESGGGKRSTPTGAGPYCEVTSRNLANFGPVISYKPSYFQPTMRFYIVSEKARSAMFNRFDLGFHIVLTHSAEEAHNSALALADEDVADNVRGFYEANNGYSPGLAEVIGCFAEPEMPKAIEHGTDKFISIFSARSMGTFLNDAPVVQLLIGEEIKNSTPGSNKFTRWAMDYTSSLKDDEVGLQVGQLQAALTFARRYFGTEGHLREPISWTESRKCLDVIKLLDKHLSILCRLLAPSQSELSVHRELAQLQVRFGCTLFDDSSARAQESRGHWVDFIGPIVAEKYVEICSVLEEKYPGSKEEVRQGYVVNRLMRGVLWRIHNGNCSSNESHDERLLECSLDSRWLSDASTVWID